MKPIRKLSIVILLLCLATSAMAQRNSPFWTVEGNTNHPDYTIIRYYDAQFALIKEEKLAGKFLDIRKKRNQKLLDKKLEDVLNEQYPITVTRRKSKHPAKRKA